MSQSKDKRKQVKSRRRVVVSQSNKDQEAVKAILPKSTAAVLSSPLTEETVADDPSSKEADSTKASVSELADEGEFSAARTAFQVGGIAQSFNKQRLRHFARRSSDHMKATHQPTSAPVSAPSGLNWGSLMALTLSLVGILIGGGIWLLQQQRQLMAQYSQPLTEQIAQVQQETLTQITAQQDSSAAQNQVMSDAIQRLQAQLTSLSDQPGWQLREIQYTVNLAQQRLTVLQDVPTALSLLQVAKAKVVNYGVQYLPRAQVMLEAAILKLDSATLPDKTQLWVALQALKSQFSQLTLYTMPHLLSEDATAQTKGNAAHDKEHLNQTKSQTQSLSAWREALDQTWQELKSLVQIQALPEQAIQNALPAARQAELQWAAHLLLEQVSWAMLQENSAIYQASLDTLANWGQQYFEANAQQSAFLEAITALKARPIDANLPDISQELETFNHLIEQHVQQI
jgi:uncharacterized protein HemX